METLPTVKTTPAQHELTNAEAEIDTLITAPQQETEIDLEFLYTRDIEFRQETIYFVVVDRFHDGDPDNSEGPNPEIYDPTRQEWGKYWGGDLPQMSTATSEDMANVLVLLP